MSARDRHRPWFRSDFNARVANAVQQAVVVREAMALDWMPIIEAFGVPSVVCEKPLEPLPFFRLSVFSDGES